jgi:tetratricopeptide (TPR) repeat protein
MREYEYAELDAIWMVKNNIGSDTVKIQLLSIYDAQMKLKDKFDFLNYEVTQNPGNSKMYYFRAVCLHEMEKYSQSNTDIDRFLLSEPKNVDALKLKFDNCFFSKDFDLAVKIIEELIDDNPTNGNFLADYGHVLLQTKKWKDAEKKFTHAIKMKTGNLSYVYLGRGIARFNLGKLGLACQDWDRSLLMGEKNAAIYIEKHCK